MAPISYVDAGSQGAGRVRVWRALKALGPAILRDGVYLLPARADLERALTDQQHEVIRNGGQAFVFHVEPSTGDESSFRKLFDRSAELATLVSTIRHFMMDEVLALNETEAPRALRALQRDYRSISATDHFPGRSREDAQALLAAATAAFEQRFSPGEPHPAQREIARLNRSEFQHRLWATRERLWVDRVASAWLIRRFVDVHARFRWLSDVRNCPPDAIGFDFDGATFTHVDNAVTFEVLMQSFGLGDDPGLALLGEMVRSLDVAHALPSAEAAGFEALMPARASSVRPTTNFSRPSLVRFRFCMPRSRAEPPVFAKTIPTPTPTLEMQGENAINTSRERLAMPESISPSLWNVIAYFLRLGATGFGGPVALANYMRRDLVERDGWFTEEEYDRGLAVATACPGPLAYQLGVYCGYVKYGLLGGISVGLAFALAPFAIVVTVAAIYVHFSSATWIRSLFYGVGPVVVALILKACWNLGLKTLKRDRLAWVIAIVACVATLIFQRELTVLFIGAGLLGIFLFSPRRLVDAATRSHTDPRSGTAVVRENGAAVMLAAAIPAAVPAAAWNLFAFFFKTGLLVFGSGLVVVSFVKANVVDQYHWLDDRAFLDAVAVGMVSPGPVVITATFVGYLVGGFGGALAATVGNFLPSIRRFCSPS